MSSCYIEQPNLRICASIFKRTLSSNIIGYVACSALRCAPGQRGLRTAQTWSTHAARRCLRQLGRYLRPQILLLFQLYSVCWISVMMFASKYTSTACRFQERHSSRLLRTHFQMRYDQTRVRLLRREYHPMPIHVSVREAEML